VAPEKSQRAKVWATTIRIGWCATRPSCRGELARVVLDKQTSNTSRPEPESCAVGKLSRRTRTRTRTKARLRGRCTKSSSKSGVIVASALFKAAPWKASAMAHSAPASITLELSALRGTRPTDPVVPDVSIDMSRSVAGIVVRSGPTDGRDARARRTAGESAKLAGSSNHNIEPLAPQVPCARDEAPRYLRP